MNTQKAIALSAIAAALLSACGGAAAPAPTAVPAARPTLPSPTAAPTAAAASGAKLPAVDPLKVTGNIVTAGSSTVFPLSQRIAEIFKDEGYKGQITIDSVGTGAGFERFCKGETDISNASAKISAAQTESCKKNNIEPIEFRVATDALAVVMDNESPFLKSLTILQLANIFSGTYKTWDQVDATFPKEKIILFSPGTDSGTFDYFVERVMSRDKKLILNANPQLSEDDNVLVRGVEGSQYAIGYFGYAYFDAERKRLKAISIEGVEPNRESVDNGKYPLARPLFLYSSAKIMKDKPQVASFINFYVNRVPDALKKVTYFPAPAVETDKARQNWLDAVK